MFSAILSMSIYSYRCTGFAVALSLELFLRIFIRKHPITIVTVMSIMRINIINIIRNILIMIEVSNGCVMICVGVYSI